MLLEGRRGRFFPFIFESHRHYEIGLLDVDALPRCDRYSLFRVGSACADHLYDSFSSHFFPIWRG